MVFAIRESSGASAGGSRGGIASLSSLVGQNKGCLRLGVSWPKSDAFQLGGGLRLTYSTVLANMSGRVVSRIREAG